jgi:hypothetical protein
LSVKKLNKMSAFLDLSHVYGSTDKTAVMVREFSGGRLRTTFRNGRQLLRSSDSMFPGCGDAERPCFVTGDDAYTHDNAAVIL